jgi:hypothetical protein
MSRKAMRGAMVMSSSPYSRHCERSEAIQSLAQDWIAASLRSSQ